MAKDDNSIAMDFSILRWTVIFLFEIGFLPKSCSLKVYLNLIICKKTARFMILYLNQGNMPDSIAF